MKFKVFKGLVVLSFILAISSCKKNTEDEPLIAEEILDIAYGSHESNTLDVYLPEGRSDTTKVIIMLHGGWWAAGDKEDLAEQAIYLRDKGFAVVSMNYRLTGTPENNYHPAQQKDIDTALNFITSKANDWRVSKKYGMLGVSAGAHLALLYTYAYNTSGRVKTVVSISGPTNFTPKANTTFVQTAAVQALLGSAYDPANPSVYIQASPVARVSSLAKPTLILHGEDDDIVPKDQAQELKAKLELLNANNVKHDMKIYAATGHDILTPANAQDIYDRVEKWFRENIK